MTDSSRQRMRRDVDEAVAATPGVRQLFASAGRSMRPPAGQDAPKTVLTRRLDSWDATISIGVGGRAAVDIARDAAAAAAAALPRGARVTIRIVRIVT